jgi:hypothetical protein
MTTKGQNVHGQETEDVRIGTICPVGLGKYLKDYINLDLPIKIRQFKMGNSG